MDTKIIVTDDEKIHLELISRLIKIQKKLKVPKGQQNDYAGFNYRSCEDILAIVKPICVEYDCLLTLSDEIECVGSRYYIKSTASLSYGTRCVKAISYAREPEEKKKMDAAQVTGSCISYARKYALGGLFLIDAAEDPDNMDNSTSDKTSPVKPTPVKPKDKPSGLMPSLVDHHCDSCKKLVTEKEHDFSLKVHKQTLCYDCQRLPKDELGKKPNSLESKEDDDTSFNFNDSQLPRTDQDLANDSF